MSEARRAIELDVEVVGTPEEVWQAIATGPGISSWYVPHVVEEREGGAALASFGDAPEMQIPGRVLAWEPPHRVVFDGGPDAEGFAFEWLVEGREGGTCIVRLVNSGFGEGAEWDDQYDAMTEGWKLFLSNLQLHRRHFPGQVATSMLPVGTTTLPRAETWAKLCADLQLPESPSVGEQVEARAPTGASLRGTVVDVGPSRVALLLDAPAPGTAFVAVEGDETGMVSVWAYLYGPDAPAIIDREKPRWTEWLEAFGSS